MKAIILAGGFGENIKGIAGDMPKPMLSIAGKPFLEHLILHLREEGIKEIILAVHYMKNTIKSYFGDGRRWNVDLTYSEESTPLGTAGAIKNAEKYINDTFMVLNGDSYSQININDFYEFHKIKRNPATMALAKVKDSSQGEIVRVDEGKIISFSKKATGLGETLINSGVYILEPVIFDYIPTGKKISIEKEIFPKLIEQKKLGGYKYEGYFMDIGRPETFHQFKKDVLRSLFLNPSDLVRKAMNKITKSGIDLVLVVDGDGKLLGILNDRLIKKFLLEGGNVDSRISEAMIRNPDKIAKIGDSQEKIYELLQSTRHLPILDDQERIVDVEFRAEKIKKESFPVIRGKAPFRISFAGGGTDLPSFYEKYGGVVINGTINKYCYGTLIKRGDSKIVINSDRGEDFIINSQEDLKYDGNFDLIKAIIKIMNPGFGFDLYLYNDIPPGRGLGSSASLAALLVKMISYLQGTEYDDYKIAEIAHKAEHEELGVKGGWQDQYAAVTGGFSFMEFDEKKTVIYPLRLKEEVINELNHHLILCYVGKTHFSGDQQIELEKNVQSSEELVIQCMHELKNIAIEIKDSLLTNNLNNVGELLHKSWENKKRCSSVISSPRVDKLYETGMQNGALGGKLLGSGGGGYILFFCPPEKRNQLAKTLEQAGGEILNFNFDFQGTHIWVSKNVK